uniref:Pre-mRNA-splicing factor SPF27 n=1 Tax=Angiostrongylus cantonensis TaxID=6313 RepID=A0A158P929_ANGCA
MKPNTTRTDADLLLKNSIDPRTEDMRHQKRESSNDLQLRNGAGRDLIAVPHVIHGHIWLYESSRGCANHLASGASYLVTFFNRIQRLLEKSKRSGGNGWNLDAHIELKKRVYNAEQLLNHMGVPVIMGGSDGEAQCAELERAGLVDGCITSDFDFFLYGGRNLYKVGLTRNRLVALALLLGCDYLQGGVNRVGIVTAREIISEFSINDDDHALTILDRFGEVTSVYLCPEVKEKKELPVVTRNMSKVESILIRECGWTPARFTQEIQRSRRRSQRIQNIQTHKITDFFPTVRRSLPSFAVSCGIDAQKHSRREWAALQRLRVNAKLYEKTEVAMEDSKVLVDALPYLDTEYNDADRQTALRLIDQECKIFRPTKNYLKHLPVPDFDVFLTPCMLKEQARMSKKQEMSKLDMSRCELPCPSGTSRAGDKVQWRKAIKNAKAQNEHLVTRQINLELMEEYAAESYLRRNRELEQLCTEAERELRRTKEELLEDDGQVMEIHARRKMAQLDAGRQLRELEGSWVAMVTNNYRMELANNQMAMANAQMAKRLRLDPSALEQLN